MGTEPVIIETALYKWHVYPRWQNLLQSVLIHALEKGEDIEGAEVVKRNMVRSVNYLSREVTSSTGLYLKQYNVRSIIDKVKYAIFKSKPAREWINLRFFMRKGVAVAKPAFFADPKNALSGKQSFLGIEEISDALYPNQVYDAPSTDRFAFLKALAEWAHTVLRSRVVFRDFQPGNILVRSRESGWEFFLIDLHAAFPGRLTPAREAWSLAKLFGGYQTWLDAQTRAEFLTAYGGGSLDGILSRKIESILMKERVRVMKNRTTRCVKDSSDFVVETKSQWKVFRSRDVALPDLMALVNGSRAAGNSAVRVTDAEVSVHVKAMERITLARNLRDQFQVSRARRAWLAMQGFAVRGVSAPIALGLIEKRSGFLVQSTYLVTRRIENALDLPGFVHRHFVLPRLEGRGVDIAFKRVFLDALARSVADLHQAGICHRDLKGQNLLIRTEGNRVKIYFTDLDSVRFAKSMTDRRRIVKNLAQLDASLPYCTGRMDRMRFLSTYARFAGLLPDRKELIKQVEQVSRTRVDSWLRLYWRERKKAEGSSQ